MSLNISDSIGPDGRCTVCNRMHENYAHVVSVNQDNQVIGSTDPDNTCHLCHRSHEDFAHFVEINGTTRVINDPSDTSSHTHRHSHPNGHSHHHQHRHRHQNHHDNRHHQNNFLRSFPEVGQSLSDDDDDIDLSGNDLIPPSYDLSPPSYEEAIHMPKPSSNTGGCSEETDPLYQNVDHSSR